jgi:hypothetical protein
VIKSFLNINKVSEKSGQLTRARKWVSEMETRLFMSREKNMEFYGNQLYFRRYILCQIKDSTKALLSPDAAMTYAVLKRTAFSTVAVTVIAMKISV